MESETATTLKSGAESDEEIHNSSSDTCCKECGAEFVDFIDYLQHVSTMHRYENQNISRCKLCGLILISLDDYARHFIDVHVANIFPCINCCRIFTSNEKLWDHQIHHRLCDDLISCSQCPMLFKNRNNLIDHEFEHKNDGETILNSNFIPHLSSYLNMEVHDFLTAIPTSRPLFCIVCKEEHKYVRDYIKHLKKGLCVSFACHLCGRPFVRKQRLSQHLKRSKCTLKAAEVTKCSKCNEVYVIKDQLKHKKSCYPIVCKICSMKFKTVYDMTKHYGKEHCCRLELLKCKYCQMCCVGPERLELHIKKHKIELYKYNCYLCKDVTYDHPKLLFAHFYSTHPNIKPYKCAICDLSFRLRKSFSIHIKIKHNSIGNLNHNNNYHVTFCNDTETTKSKLVAKEISVPNDKDKDITKETNNKQELENQTTENANLKAKKQAIIDTIHDTDTEPNKLFATPDSAEVNQKQSIEQNTLIKRTETKDTVPKHQGPILIINAQDGLAKIESDNIATDTITEIQETKPTNSKPQIPGPPNNDEASQIDLTNNNDLSSPEKVIPNVRQPVLVIDGRKASDVQSSLSKNNEFTYSNADDKTDDNNGIIDDKDEHQCMDEVEYLELSDSEYFEVIKSQINVNNNNDNRKRQSLALNSDSCDNNIPTESQINTNNNNGKPDSSALNLDSSDNNIAIKPRINANNDDDNEKLESYALNSDSSDDNIPIETLKKKKSLKVKRSKKKDTVNSDDEQHKSAKTIKKYGKKRKNVRNSSNKFICPYCNVKCYTFQNFARHKSLHSRNESKQCLKCGKLFQTLTELNEHLSNDHKSSVLTDKLHDILEQRKIKSKFNIKAIKVDKINNIPSVSIKKYEKPKSELKSFLESYASDADVERKTVKVQIKVVKETREAKIKTTKLDLHKKMVFTGLAKPVPFKRPNETEMTKVKIALGNLANAQPKLNFGIDTEIESNYNDFIDDNISEVDLNTDDGHIKSSYELSIPEVGQEVMLTADDNRKNVVKQGKIFLPEKSDVKTLRIGHLTSEAPYYKIVKASDIIPNSGFKEEKKRVAKINPKFKLPEGVKFVNVNPLEHLIAEAKKRQNV